MRLGLRNPTRGEPDASAFHSMSEAARRLRRRGPAREDLEVQARTPPAANAMRLAPRRRADQRARRGRTHHMPEGAGRFRARGRRGETRKPSVAASGSRMLCGWRCDADLRRAPDAHALHSMPKRPAPSGDLERRRGILKVKRGRPAGPRMRCGWGCGEQLAGRNMRAHFTICARWRQPLTTWSDDGGAWRLSADAHRDR
jgi:hypothetical protein